jgi:hypothetical protein
MIEIWVATESGHERPLERLSRALTAGESLIVVVSPGAWIPDQMEALIVELARELDVHVPNWGLCGNLALAPDGCSITRCLKDVPATGLHRTDGPKPVLALGDSVVLVNTRALIRAEVKIPNGHGDGWAAALSAACLRKGLLSLIDDRLFCVHPDRRVPDPRVSAIDALLPLFDAALIRGRGTTRPSIVMVCRTQLDRPALLTRTVRSFAVAAREAASLADVSIRLVSDVAGEGLEAEADRLGDVATGIELTAWHFPARSKPLSRIDLLLACIRTAKSDFIWFVDDDDFLQPGAIAAVARVLRPSKPQLVVGHSRMFSESWGSLAQDLKPASSRPGWLRRAEHVLLALGGDNHTPLCSVVFSLPFLRERTESVLALGEYYEDYFLLLEMLTGGNVLLETLDVELAAISMRGQENTITRPDRSAWNQSQATFVGEALARRGSNNALLWRLTAELLEARHEAGRIPDSPWWRSSKPVRSLKRLIRYLRLRR